MTITTLIIAIASGVFVATVVFAVASMFRSPVDTAMHDRLDILAGGKSQNGVDDSSVLTRPLDDMPTAFEDFVSNFFNVRRWLDQAGIDWSTQKFVGTCAIAAAVGLAIAVAINIHFSLYAVLPLIFVSGPFLWVAMARKKRMKLFEKQLPEALDMIGRALKAGHSLGSGFQLVSKEIPEPLGVEFGRVYEEQNLGIAMEDSLMNVCGRVPSLDLRFFATAVILQRTTGGDLAEILEKISMLIRERFKIWGQIQALTGEGRLSGIVLLALPPVLFGAMMFLNREYIMLLVNTEMGNQMLLGAGLMQLVGAIVIKKIINIKV